MSITVDTRGKLCPLPLILFRKAIKEHPEERDFEVLTDNKISCANLIDFIQQHQFNYTEEHVNAETTRLLVTVPKQAPETAPEHTSTRPERGIRVLQLRSDVMGDGDEKLGGILILAYLNALKELDEKPTHIICYNSGAKLATRGHDASQSLLQLQALGIEVIVCGTCANYYGITDELALGKISNMLTIAELLQQADHIVTP